MSTSVVFESPPGNILNTRQFSPGQAIRISGKCVGPLGLGEPGTYVTLDIHDSFPSVYSSTYTNLLGDYHFDIVLPNVSTQATVHVCAQYTLGGIEDVTVPIGIGESAPPLPSPPPSWEKTLEWIGIGLFALIVTVGVWKLVRKVP